MYIGLGIWKGSWEGQKSDGHGLIQTAGSTTVRRGETGKEIVVKEGYIHSSHCLRTNLDHKKRMSRRRGEPQYEMENAIEIGITERRVFQVVYARVIVGWGS